MTREPTTERRPMPPPGPRGGGPMHGGARVEKAKDPRRAFIRLARYLLPYKWRITFVFLLVIIGSVLSLLGPYLLGVAIDGYILKGDVHGLFTISLLMLGIYVANWVSQSLQGLVMVSISQNALKSLRKDLFEHLQTLSLSYFDKRTHGELMSRLTNDIDAISQTLSQSITQLFSSSLTFVGILFAMFILNMWLALTSLLVLPVMILMTVFVGKRTLAGFRILQARLGDLNGSMEEAIGGERVVQAFGQQGPVLNRFDEANRTVRDAAIEANTYAMIIPPLVNVMSSFSIAVIAGVGGWMAVIGSTTIGTIATFISYSRSFVQPLRQLADLYNSVQTALAGAERVFETIDEKPEITDKPDAYPLEKISGEVAFNHITFSYIPNILVLKDMSLHAKPGETVAFVGPTGAGKTTMVNVLSRFYDIQEGSISIDGYDIRDVKVESLRRHLGVVLQDDFLFADTVIENIRYGNLTATDEECIAAAELANADQFVVRLPKGYNTTLSERGSNLSQGQRQLLTIARAIIANPSILILDEATSSVDTRTEINIQQALLKLMKGRTSFVIAHRLSTIRKSDQVLVINEGRIVERGTHDSLLRQKGFYYNLYMSQFKGTNTQAEWDSAT